MGMRMSVRILSMCGLHQLVVVLTLLVRLLRCLLNLLVLRAIHARHLLRTWQGRTHDIGHSLGDRDMMPLIVNSNEWLLLWLDEWRGRRRGGWRRNGLWIRLCARRLLFVVHICVSVRGPVWILESFGCDFLGCEESATRATGTSHRMLVTRLVQIGLGCLDEFDDA